MFDYMGNASRYRWTDEVNWEHMKSRTRAVTAAAMAAPGPVVVVRGHADRDGTGALDTCYTLTDRTLDSGSHTVETLDAGGGRIASVGFTPDHRVPHVSAPLESADFGFVLPFSDSVRTIRLLKGSDILDSIAVSATDPSASFVSIPSGRVEGTVTVSWQGSDADGDALVYSLFYSPDGVLRIPLVEETAATSYQWDSTWVPSGSAPRLTLVASDGVRATVVDSSTFDVADRPPEVAISLPVDGDVYPAGTPVPLSGHLNDAEDGFGGETPLDWSSSRDGALGSGTIFSVATLSEGTHVITATGRDSAGNTGSDSVTITVTSGPACSLACDPVVPSGGTAGVALDFAAGVTASHCADPVEVRWSFGDGSSSSDPAARHAYSRPGSFRWELLAWSGAAVCEQTGIVPVKAGDETFHYLIPASPPRPMRPERSAPSG